MNLKPKQRDVSGVQCISTSPQKHWIHMTYVKINVPIAITLPLETLAFQQSIFLVRQHSGKTEYSARCNIDSCRTFSWHLWRSRWYFCTADSPPCCAPSADLLSKTNRTELKHSLTDWTIKTYAQPLAAVSYQQNQPALEQHMQSREHVFSLHPNQAAHSMNLPLFPDWIVQCFTSPPTQYRLYGRRFLPTVSKYWRRKL